jgi:hypothetical protein
VLKLQYDAETYCSPATKPPDLPPEKTYAVLKKQLTALETLRGRNFREADSAETEWENFTLNILTRGFGEGSQNVSQFHSARWRGQHRIGGMSDGQLQRNYDLRIEAYAAVLKSSMSELELFLPDPELAGAYEPGDEYEFYRDLKTIVGLGTKELFITDAYLDTQLFDVYMENVNQSVVIRILTNQLSDPLRIVAGKFASRGNFELRSSKDVHDRVVFADDRCWVIVQSIKDAAKKKATYIVEHTGASAMKAIYDAIWATATVVVKG